jgi:tetratricopeptide (TPR) repeat protein
MTEAEILDELDTFGLLERADALYVLANRQVTEERLDEAEHFSSAARHLYTEVSDNLGAARAAFVEGYCLLQKLDYEAARCLFQEALDSFSVFATDEWTANILYNLGVCNFGLENYKSAIECYEQSASLFRSSDQPALAARSKIDIGELRGTQGNQKLALGPFGEALRLYRQSGDLAGVAKAHDRLAAVLIDLGDTGAAIDHLREAWNIVSLIDLKSGIPYAQRRLGQALVSESQFQEAEELLVSSSNLYKESQDYVLAAEAQESLAIVYEKTGREDQALVTFNSCLSIYKASDKESRVLWLRKYIAQKEATKNLDNPIQECEDILQISQNLGNRWLTSQLEVTLANFYLSRSKRGDRAKARDLIKKLEDTLVSDDALLKASLFLAKAKLLLGGKNQRTASSWLELVLESGKDTRFQQLKYEAKVLLRKLNEADCVSTSMVR